MPVESGKDLVQRGDARRPRMGQRKVSRCGHGHSTTKACFDHRTIC
jgi:hypothetical protein